MNSLSHNPQIDPIFKRGSNGAGVLLIHGFTGTPDSMRPLANALHKEGFTVSAPLLAGHGSTPANCAKTTWKDWFQSVQKAYMALHEKCSLTFVSGLSLGSLLTLKLSMEYPQSIHSFACLSTPLYFQPWIRVLLPMIHQSPMKHFWKYQKKVSVDLKDPQAKENFWNYDRMPLSCIASILDLQKKLEPNLHKIEMPILLLHSRHDSTAPYDSMNKISSKVCSKITETITLENSFHVITIDYEKDLVASKICEFFKRFL